MPYTPPLHRSPSSSLSSSPEISRRSSLLSIKATAAPSTHATLPRSASYLTRHRRTPSAVAPVPAGQPTPPATSENLAGMVSVTHGHDENSSLRQSPPPVTGSRQIPNAAVISPPESPSNSSDDDEPAPGKRGRQIEDLDELKQLHEAISQLPRRRDTSPSETSDSGVPMVRPLPQVDLMHHSFSTSSLDQLSRRSALIARSTSSHGRRVSHFRSATEPSVPVSPSCGSSLTASDDEDADPNFKPQMVRKKSGELVRPALRLGSRRRPSSMPGTPTFSKAVHFDSHLEHVRHFLQVDRPLAVSAGSSPVETYDSESEYPFGGGEGVSSKPVRRVPPYEWELTLTKFPVDSPARKALPVRLERVWLSSDQKSLLGSVAVRNLAFSKWVVCRFTMDYWKTTSEVAAEYSAEILPRVATEGHDRFNFAIKLSDTANLENKTLFFCIRYNVDGKEFWDSNGGGNFQVDFKKKMLPINGKAGMQDGHSLPRSSGRRVNHSGAQRPVSMPATLDDFGSGTKLMFDQSLQDYLGEPVPRLKSSMSTSSIPSDNLSNRLPTPSGQAFANRYDFGASLSAAMQATKESGKDALFMKPHRRVGIASPPPTTANTTPAATATKSSASATNTGRPPLALNTSQQPKPSTIALPIATLDRDSRAILAGSSALNGPGSIASKSYDEIVSKYCFYVPNQSTQTRDTAVQNGQVDGANGELVTQNQAGSPTSSSSDGSPLQMGGLYQHPPTAVRHSMTVGYHNNFGHSAAPMEAMAAVSEKDQQPRSMVPEIMMAAAPSATNSTTSSSGSASPASPASLVGAFPPFAATPTPPADYPFQHIKERFAFVGTEHSTTAIRG